MRAGKRYGWGTGHLAWMRHARMRVSNPCKLLPLSLLVEDCGAINAANLLRVGLHFATKEVIFLPGCTVAHACASY